METNVHAVLVSTTSRCVGVFSAATADALKHYNDWY